MMDAYEKLEKVLFEIRDIDVGAWSDAMENSSYESTMRQYVQMLTSRNSFPVVLEIKGEDWYRHELGIFGEDFDAWKKKLKIKSIGLKSMDEVENALDGAIFWGKHAEKMCRTESYISSTQSPVHILTGKIDSFLSAAGSELSIDGDDGALNNYTTIYNLNKALKDKIAETALASEFEEFVFDLVAELKSTKKQLTNQLNTRTLSAKDLPEQFFNTRQDLNDKIDALEEIKYQLETISGKVQSIMYETVFSYEVNTHTQAACDTLRLASKDNGLIDKLTQMLEKYIKDNAATLE